VDSAAASVASTHTETTLTAALSDVGADLFDVESNDSDLPDAQLDSGLLPEAIHLLGTLPSTSPPSALLLKEVKEIWTNYIHRWVFIPLRAALQILLAFEQGFCM